MGPSRGSRSTLGVRGGPGGGRTGGSDDGETSLVASAVSGRSPPAGPQRMTRPRPPEAAALAYEKALCVSQDGFTLRAATRAGAGRLDAAGREATELPARSPNRGPPYWRSTILRRRALGGEDA